ncbi:MAG: HK97 family phage prohead protease [Pseudomonadota bacterium]
MAMPPTSARAGGLETKFVSLGDLDRAAAGRIEGYASIFGEADQGGDVVMPGAFRRSLARLEEEGRKVKFLWQHDPAEPIGVWRHIREDATGLYVQGEILAEVSRGAEALALMSVGAIDGLSIGYRTVRAEKAAQGGRMLHEIDLWEVSLVTFPMLPTARASLGEPRLTGDLVQALAEALSG